ncbi:MAG TPA: Dyp-type peroxidase [Micromonosporaceae bacterium]
MTGGFSEVSRRRLLTGGALVAGAALAGAAVGAAATAPDDRSAVPAADLGGEFEPFIGAHQAGIVTVAQAHAAFVAFDLRDGVDRAALARLMRLWTDDAARLTRGEAALADTEPELAAVPARLTVTFGFGPGVFRAAGLEHLRPPAVAALPPFPIDRLERAWSDGDLLVQICADDPLTVSHAQRMLVKDARPFCSVRWVQSGFLDRRGVRAVGETPRNLFGQVDGTVNPSPDVFDQAVWVSEGPDWLRGGTTVVIRRIRLDLEGWDLLGRAERELVIGRRLDNGAPLTGRKEHDPPDFTATDEHGLPVIPEFAHIRRAHVGDERLRILRRSYNYDLPPAADGTADAGLIFVSYQADVERQFLPIQRRLAELDMLNRWTTPIGSAVFAVPPGCAPDGWIGDRLLG